MDTNKDVDNENNSDSPSRKKPYLKIVGAIFLFLVIAIGLAAGYIYAITPAVIRNPKLEHLHFRMQFIVDGRTQNFASHEYQTPYVKDLCNADLPEQPIHFHDDKDQFAHIHWKGITGGMVLKYYGHNMIGGQSGILGYRLDQLPKLQTVPIHGNVLPAEKPNNKLFIYTGDQNSYTSRAIDDFKNQDLEKFFGKESNFAKNTGQKNETKDEELTRINNLLGNVVIFAQKEKPTDAQIKERFNKLTPLDDSVCGG